MRIEQGENTYIQISKEVRDRLSSEKIVPRESYEDVLRRLLNMSKRLIILEQEAKEKDGI